jgi:ADP-ribose pyrophosphatase YjhB (NUDIX family)
VPGINDPQPRWPCAGAVVHDEWRRLLLVRRGREPSAGRWSVPGGRCLPGETPGAACARETAEETGLQVRVGRVAGQVVLAGPNGLMYDVTDYVCTVVGGALRAGDDAAEARWVSRAEFDVLPLVPGLADTLAEWALLPG